jgi:hypothetical protein
MAVLRLIETRREILGKERPKHLSNIILIWVYVVIIDTHWSESKTAETNINQWQA